MRSFKTISKIISLLIVTSLFASQETQASTAQYFRAWQGFQRSDLSSTQFLKQLPAFMKKTVAIYDGRGLNNYIVTLPPAQKPSFIPDELALVALESEADYQQVRSTPEGKAYGESHWQIFDRERSASAPMVDYWKVRPTQLVSNSSYDMTGDPIDWNDGVTMVFVGTKKNGISSRDFLQRLNHHVQAASRALSNKGLRGYIFIANDNYEVAYMNWSSKTAHDKAGQTSVAKKVFAEAGALMDTLMYIEAQPFVAGSSVAPGQAYSTYFFE